MRLKSYVVVHSLVYWYWCWLGFSAPAIPVAELGGHTQCVNTIAWAPHSSCHICTGGDDAQALIWDLSGMPKPITGAVAVLFP